MGVRIEITADPVVTAQIGLSQRDQIDQALDAIGFARQSIASPGLPALAGPFTGEGSANCQKEEAHAAPVAEAPASAPVTEQPAPTVARERGKPSPGRARRTKEEIAEDEAAERAEAPAQQISTQPENRVDPETAAQDAADEQAEAEASKTADALSHDDVRQALGRYVEKFGMAAAQEDGPKLLALLFKDGSVTKISSIPDDQAELRRVVSGVEEMLAKNPYKREAVA